MSAAVTEAEAQRVHTRMRDLERAYAAETTAPTILAHYGMTWTTVGADLVASVAGIPVVMVPWAVLLDPEADGVVPESLPDSVPESWT